MRLGADVIVFTRPLQNDGKRSTFCEQCCLLIKLFSCLLVVVIMVIDTATLFFFPWYQAYTEHWIAFVYVFVEHREGRYRSSHCMIYFLIFISIHPPSRSYRFLIHLICYFKWKCIFVYGSISLRHYPIICFTCSQWATITLPMCWSSM